MTLAQEAQAGESGMEIEIGAFLCLTHKQKS
jgi:hypothetical protein